MRLIAAIPVLLSRSCFVTVVTTSKTCMLCRTTLMTSLSNLSSSSDTEQSYTFVHLQTRFGRGWCCLLFLMQGVG